MHTLISIASKWQRAFRGRGAACLVLVAALLLLPVVSGCQTEAQDRDFNFNNPLDPNPDDGDDDDGDNTGQVVISYVDELNNVVILVNAGIEDTDVTGWTLENEDGTASYPFPGFTLDAAQFVRVTSGTGADGPNDLFTGSITLNWGSTFPNEEVFLFDASGDPVDSCRNGADACWP